MSDTDELIVPCRRYIAQAQATPVGPAVEHPADCPECGGARTRPATPEERAAADAAAERAFRFGESRCGTPR